MYGFQAFGPDDLIFWAKRSVLFWRAMVKNTKHSFLSPKKVLLRTNLAKNWVNIAGNHFFYPSILKAQFKPRFRIKKCKGSFQY